MGQHRCWVISVVLFSIGLPASVWGSFPLLRHGVASGDVTDTSAVIRARADGDTTLIVEYTTASEFSDPHNGGSVRVTAETDFTGTVTLTKFRPASRYYYRIR